MEFSRGTTGLVATRLRIGPGRGVFMEVDSFRYLSPLIKRYYQLSQVKREIPIPFAPVRKPLRQCRFALVTSGGLYHRGHDRPFDQERERREPSWGDPSFRILPADMDPAEVGISHLHINGKDALADMGLASRDAPADRGGDGASHRQLPEGHAPGWVA